MSNSNKKIKFLPLPYIGMFDLDLIYQTSDVELLYQILSKVNEIAQSQNIIIDNFEKILDWAQNQIEQYTKEQLQEWLDDGTLETLFKNVFSPYNNVQEMINDSNIKENNLCVTLGYYEVNDKGFNTWHVIKTQPTTGYYVQLSNGLYAIRNNTGINNIMQYGVKADFEEPQQTLIQKAIDESTVLYFNEGIYFVSLATPYSLNCHDNLTIIGNNSTIKGIGNYQDSYYTVIGCSNKNILIKNITIDGAKELVTVTGEHGMGSTVTGDNVMFENVTFQNCFGDGIIIDQNAKNIMLINCIFDSCRRQGITITGCNGVMIKNCEIKNISGTAPEDGIDIEPYEDKACQNITIENVYIHDCSGMGIQGYYGLMTTKSTSMHVNNVIIENCLKGIGLYELISTNNIINIENVSIKTVEDNSIYIKSIPNGDYLVSFNNINLYGINEDAIVIDGDDKQVKGITFNNLECVVTSATFDKTIFNFLTTVGVSNIKIYNTNADIFKNWTLVEELEIKNNPLYINEGTTLDFINGKYYSEIYVDSNVTIIFNNIVSTSKYCRKTSPIRIYILNNWNVTIQSVSFNQSLSILGSNGTKITGNSGGSNLTIQGIRNLLCITQYTGNWQPNT